MYVIRAYLIYSVDIYIILLDGEVIGWMSFYGFPRRILTSGIS